MSQENVEVLRRSFGYRDEGRFDDWIGSFDPDVEWDISAYPLPDFPDHGVGRDALLGHLGDYFAGWNDYESSISAVFDAGENVVVILRERARMRASDVIIERDLPQVWTIRDGRLCHFRVFKTRSEALRAAGLEA